jgi:putative aldouronate transport system substrate-binding protein
VRDNFHKEEGEEMLKMKKSLMILLAAALVIVSACSNTNNTGGSKDSSKQSTNQVSSSNQTDSSTLADPFGKYEEPITISIGIEVDPTDTSLPSGDSPTNNQYTRNIKENLNIDVEHAFTASPANYKQKVSLSIASNDLPDAMIVGPVELRQLYEAGQLEDLTDVYNNYASPTIKRIIESTGGLALEAVTFDGKIMAIPGVQLQADGVHTLWLRKDWLDKLNLDPPQTVEDLVKVARAFVEQDPDGNNKKDTIGLAGPDSSGKLYANFLESSNNVYGFDGIFAAFNSYPGYWLEEDGKAVYGSLQPETKEALAQLRSMYADGLIDQEMGVREESSESIISGNTGMFFAPWWMGYGPLGEAITVNPEANWQAYALPLDGSGKYSPHMSTPSSSFVVVRKGYEHPEAVMKMQNNLLAQEGAATFDPSKGGPAFYPLRLVFAPADETEYEVKALREVMAGTKTAEDFKDKPEYKLLYSDAQVIKNVKLEPYDNLDIQHWNTSDLGVWKRAYSLLVGGTPLVDNDINGVYSVAYAQTKTMESRWVNLKKLEDETFLKIVMGVAPLDTFDQFVKDWKNQGGDQITSEVSELVK